MSWKGPFNNRIEVELNYLSLMNCIVIRIAPIMTKTKAITIILAFKLLFIAVDNKLENETPNNIPPKVPKFLINVLDLKLRY